MVGGGGGDCESWIYIVNIVHSANMVNKVVQNSMGNARCKYMKYVITPLPSFSYIRTVIPKKAYAFPQNVLITKSVSSQVFRDHDMS